LAFVAEPVIRPARPGDGAGLTSVWVDLCEYYTGLNPDLFQIPSADGLPESFERDLAVSRAENISWLVAEVDGGIVGWIYAHVLAPLPDARWQLLRELGKPRLVIEALGVRRAFWRRGIGARLVRAVEGWALTRGAELVSVDTYIDSPVSVVFYENTMGYERRSLRFQRDLGR
jgi:GNAT superfamily N-acetyltransferase